MARGRLDLPDLDDRTWQDIVEEAKGLIPRYAPEWTDHNPSDLGIALIELFGWLVEGMIYRLNQVPAKNYLAFLNLLGITRDPATPASVMLTVRLAGGNPPLTVPRRSQAATPQGETGEAVIFETDEDQRVLPVNLTTALHIGMVGAATQYGNISTSLVSAPLSGLSLELPAGSTGSITLALGFDQPTTQAIALRLRFARPTRKNDCQVTWLYSMSSLQPAMWPAVPLPNVVDGTDSFQKNGVTTLTVPNTWGAQSPQAWTGVPARSPADQVTQSLYWVGIRVSNLLATPLPLGHEHILFNSVPATNALTTGQPELLGVSSGRPLQSFELRNRPLYKRPRAPDPFDHLVIQVRESASGGGFGPWTTWTRVEDFPEGDGRQYRLDPVTGTIRFGNRPAGASVGYGLIPPTGSEVQALTYRCVAGGGAGNVPPSTVTVMRTPITGIVGVTNPGAATGGSDEEDVESTKERGPQLLRNRYRAVSKADYEYLAREASTDVKKVGTLPPRLWTASDTLPAGVQIGDPWTYGGLNRDTGNVHVIVIPDAPATNARPMPSADLLQEVSDYLDQRRGVTAALHVTFPRYLPIDVQADLRIFRRAIDTRLVASAAAVEADVRSKIERYLHPILGGVDGNGWEVGQDILISGLLDAIRLDANVGFVASLTIQAGTPAYTPTARPLPSAPPGVWVQLADYEIVCSGARNVTSSVV
jgi:uncharacterized phage protein gp47/JayE